MRIDDQAPYKITTSSSIAKLHQATLVVKHQAHIIIHRHRRPTTTATTNQEPTIRPTPQNQSNIQHPSTQQKQLNTQLTRGTKKHPSASSKASSSSKSRHPHRPVVMVLGVCTTTTKCNRELLAAAVGAAAFVLICCCCKVPPP